MDKALFVGDFNIHTDNHQDTDTINFLDIINRFNLQNLVTFLTHVKQHHLDLILDDPNNLLVHNIEPGMFLSDHCFIHCQLTIKKNPKNRIGYINQLAEHPSDSKKIFEIANKMLYRNEPLPLPSTDNTLKLVNDFNSFFIQKIDNIMTGLIPTESHPVDPKYIESIEKCSIKLQFHEIDLDEAKRLIRTSATKSCEIDPMPTSLLKECIDIVAAIIMEIINLLLTTQIMPNQMKEALICPLLKKINLDSLQFKNYRPILNLAFISKLIEHAVCDQLMDHAYKTGNLERL